jgi:RNA polymerase sigma-70 factor (ECF subfamily)
MNESELLAQRFEENRARLRPVAYRVLGSLSEADDALQEAWLRLSRSDAAEIENLTGWLTTVVARVCLDMLRARAHRREEPLEERAAPPSKSDPETEALLADSVGLALLVVLNRLAPAERLAFVLHDLFAVPFDEIASIVGRSEAAARQLASRARRRVQGGSTASGAELGDQRKVVSEFLAALRAGDFEGLLAVLDPDVVVHGGGAGDVRGAEACARQAMGYARGARFLQMALVNGAVGLMLAPRGRLSRVIALTIKDGKIAGVDVMADRAAIGKLELSILPTSGGDDGDAHGYPA